MHEESNNVTPKQREKFNAKSIVFLVFLLSSPFLILSFVWRDHCKSFKVASYLSPNKLKVVNYIKTTCDATKNALSVNLAFKKKPDESFTNETVILLLQTDEIAAPTWTGNSTINLSISKDLDVVKHRLNYNDTIINIKKF